MLEKTFIDDVRATIVPELRPGYFVKEEQVLSLNYDDFYQDYKIAFVKIDVEGAELDVLTGMKNSLIKYKPIIVCEVLDSHDESVLEFTQHRASELSSFLHNIGFELIQFETNNAHEIIAFTKIDSISIKQWTTESYNLNDYLFYPSERELEIFQKLNQIVN